MAIDRNKTGDLIRQINELFETMLPDALGDQKIWVKEKIMSQAVEG